MFGSQKPQVQTAIKSGPVFDPKTIPAHTMQDDLDVLSGKAKTAPTASAEDIKSGPFMESTTPPVVSKVEEPRSSVKISNDTINISKEPMRANKPFGQAGIPVGMPKPLMNPSKEAPKASNLGKLTGILLGVLVLLIASGGGYYFYMTRYNTPVIDLEPVVPVEDVPEVVPEVIVPEKFSADNPNYLLLDVEEMAREDIQKLFIQKAVEIKEDKKTAPIEFVVTDANNNPIALKIFAKLMNITFSSKLLETFQDDFSVYIFSDGEAVRLGLNISPKDALKTMSDMKNEEKVLIKGLEPLFLGEAMVAQSVVFQDADHSGVAIRYLNLNGQGNLSVDYFMKNDKLVIATSKNTAWAVIDKAADAGETSVKYRNWELNP